MSRLIYTSSASVALSGYLGKAPFAVVVNQTESRIKPASCDSDLIIPGYAVTKNRAERIILGGNGANLANGTGNFIKNSTFSLQSMQQSFDYFVSGELLTCAIRPTVIYGEEDPYFFPTIAKATKKTGGLIPKLLGAGGKHQITYAGKYKMQFNDERNFNGC